MTGRGGDTGRGGCMMVFAVVRVRWVSARNVDSEMTSRDSRRYWKCRVFGCGCLVVSIGGVLMWSLKVFVLMSFPLSESIRLWFILCAIVWSCV